MKKKGEEKEKEKWNRINLSMKFSTLFFLLLAFLLLLLFFHWKYVSIYGSLASNEKTQGRNLDLSEREKTIDKNRKEKEKSLSFSHT